MKSSIVLFTSFMEYVLKGEKPKLVCSRPPSPPAEARDSLRAHIARGVAHGDTVEVKALNPNVDIVYVAKRSVQDRLQMIEAARRGNVGVDEYALRFFRLTPPLRVRELLGPVLRRDAGSSRSHGAHSPSAQTGLDRRSFGRHRFSREYKRFFGEPPMRDVERLRGSGEGDPSGAVRN